MQLPGRLGTTTLGDLLGALHRERITGQLELTERKGPIGAGISDRTHRIHLSAGLVTFVESDVPVMPLGEILYRSGLVGPRAIVFALGRIKAGDRRTAGEILVDAGLARPEFIRAGLRKQVQQRLEALFAIDDAIVTFHAARPHSGVDAKVSPLWPAEFLHGRARARDRVTRPGVRAAGWASAGAAAGASRASGVWPPASEAPPPRTRPRDAFREGSRAEAYHLLGIDQSASTAEVRRAFRKLAATLHPDRCSSAGAEERARSAARFARLSAAYHLLVA